MRGHCQCKRGQGKAATPDRGINKNLGSALSKRRRLDVAVVLRRVLRFCVVPDRLGDSVRT